MFRARYTLNFSKNVDYTKSLQIKPHVIKLAFKVKFQTCKNIQKDPLIHYNLLFEQLKSHTLYVFS